MKKGNSKKVNKIVIKRENVSLTNQPDTSYVNLRESRGQKLINHLENGGEIIVIFKQYETIAHKKRNQAKLTIVKNVSSLELLGLRANVNGYRYYRYKISGPTMVREFKNELKVGTAFSGLGCPEYALKQLGINHSSEFVIDIDKHARKTLIENYNPKRVLEDITQVDTSKLPSTDIYVWGSPCPDHSQNTVGCANARTGLNGPTGRLFWDGYKILKDTLPMVSIFENVKGLLSVNGGVDFETMIEAFQVLPYNIYFKVVNPLDIGGATNRERIFIVGVRKDINEKFNFPENTDDAKPIKDFLIDGVEHDYEKYANYLVPAKPLEEQKGRLKKDFLWLGTARESDQRVFNVNYPAPTFTKSCHLLINDGVGVRKATVEEIKAIQGFGDDLSFEGITKTQIKLMLGNTMEVNTMKALMGEAVRIINIHAGSNKKVIDKNLINPRKTTLYTYLGNKMKFTHRIHRAINTMRIDKVECFIDAFAGSMNFTINNIEKIKARYYILNDLNPILYSTYKAIKQNYKKVSKYYLEIRKEFFKSIPKKYIDNKIKFSNQKYCKSAREFYIRTVDRLNYETDIYKIAAIFIWKMQYTTGGNFKYKKDGKISTVNYNWSFNVRDKLNHIKYYSQVLNKYDVIIENLDVFELIKKYEKYSNDSFIYLDPPYLNTKIDYSLDNSDEFQIKLLEKTNHFKYKLYSNSSCESLYKLGINNYFIYEDIFDRNTNIGTSNKNGKEYLAFSINENFNMRVA
ncbi:DNA (cytosine-5-)-methyltransferase [Aliarcobacter butzleri]|uniref:DNA (cytosine-5-)-methyltransferase n=1 Tax=Aliarcobacter butzleri TaxID=28197 RepID=UPI001EDB8F9B|nr:DNA (cytosine-5-)-methyltransferase [Aliarcobacter butzleri]MCG3666099.1 DNA (cytosine-5-)-methyltransferase [Aliarcobacter butzleri]